MLVLSELRHNNISHLKLKRKCTYLEETIWKFHLMEVFNDLSVKVDVRY